MKLPVLENTILIPDDSLLDSSILITSEGFEERSLCWVKSLPKQKLFAKSIIFQNIPIRKSRLSDLEKEVISVSVAKPEIIEFNRYDLEGTESLVRSIFTEFVNGYKEVFIDISVMSRILIVILVYLCKKMEINLNLVYSEPEEYAPTKEDFYLHLERQQVASIAPTSGVRQVVRTPLLSSSIMSNAPTIVVGFTSFNEQLLRALLSSLNPSRLFLINSIPPHLKWRAEATFLVHKDIVSEYTRDNPISDDKLLVRRSSTLKYQETFDIIADIYRKYCYTHRIVIAPTGSKMQSVACALLKSCCPDIHIEYPTPESYYVENFSSSKIRNQHHIKFCNFAEFISQFSEAAGLNG